MEQDMSIELKIKSKSLAAEARIIRAEEAKILSRLDGAAGCSDEGLAQDQDARARSRARVRFLQAYRAIRAHRCGLVRSEARRTFLARGFLSGRPYRRIENRAGRALTEQDWKGIEVMVLRYGAGDSTDRVLRFRQWRKDVCALPESASPET